MNVTKTTRIHSITLALSFPLVLMLFAADAECAQAGQKRSDELLLEVMDLHSALVTNEIFLAQAKMLGAYLEAAQPLEESKKIKIYVKVLNILSKIKTSPIEIKEIADEPESVAEQKPLEEEKQEAKSVYEPGAALLEIFKIDPDKNEIPDLPIIRTYWRRDLAYSGAFLLPDRLSEIGKNSPYAAKFSFYYEAKKLGRYGFTLEHFPPGWDIFQHDGNVCKLSIGGVEIIDVSREPVVQGVCNLKKGFHRVEFWLVSKIPYWQDIPGSRMANFQVKVLPPGAFDAVPITKDMMLLKKE
ncbi:MAG TPA: hypothetical protein VMW72_12900 [Sedimentisphaerales bacterium]|nr:hypothetical protein [Sedimentisphaerales bacterium]